MKRFSNLWLALVAALAVEMHGPQIALADPGDEAQEPRSVRVSCENEEWYREPLLAGYLAPPVALGVTTALTSIDQNNPSLLPIAIVGGIGFFAPPAVHLLYDNFPGIWISIVGMLGSAGAGALMGAAVTELAPSCDEDDPHGVCRDDVRGLMIGGLAGLGYLTWVVIDVGFFARRPSDRQYALQPAVRPVFAQRPDGNGGRGVELSGMQLVLQGSL